MGYKIEILREGKIIGDDTSNRFGFYAWPTVAKLKDGTLIIACSGRRTRHIDPFGTAMACYSKDEGKTWSKAAAVIDTPLDDRDGGVCVLPSGKTFVTSFTNTIAWQRHCVKETDRTEEQKRMYTAYLDMLTQEDEAKYHGSLMAESEDGYVFGEPYKVPVGTPHGPVVLKNGKMFFAGIDYPNRIDGVLSVYQSEDGHTWTRTGEIREGETADGSYMDEPHAVDLDDGTIVVQFRKSICFVEGYLGQHIITMQCESKDGGYTFSEPKLVFDDGAPPFLLKHSSGALIAAYGHRLEPFAERVRFSDDGKTWSEPFDINTSPKFFDHGYHSVAELSDGSVISVYYQTRKEPYFDGTVRDYSNGVYYTVWKFTKENDL